jgi:hypothetical protein
MVLLVFSLLPSAGVWGRKTTGHAIYSSGCTGTTKGRGSKGPAGGGFRGRIGEGGFGGGSARAFGVAARSRREGGGRLVPRPPARRLGLVSTFRERLRRIWAVRLVPSWVLDLGFRDGWRDSAGFTGGCRNLQKAEGRGDHAPARAYVGPAFFLLFSFLAGGAVHSLPVLKLSSSDHK